MTCLKEIGWQTVANKNDATLHMIVSGRVQAVGFRHFVQMEARASGLTGTVKNLSDGSVEIYTTGAPKTLLMFMEKVSEGPPISRVKSIEARWSASYRQFNNFQVLA
tara:strand:+ start:1040 stop:1360 length:321 start_codon:yes stop_codon:yes gene_type:complete